MSDSLFVSSLSCCCKVMEALYVLKTFALRPGMRELKCLFSETVCNETEESEGLRETHQHGMQHRKATESQLHH